MRTPTVIFVCSVLLLTLSAVVADYEIHKRDQIAAKEVSEMVQYSRDTFSGKSASSTNDARSWPIIRGRRKRENASNCGEATKGRGDARSKKKRERGRGRWRGGFGDGKGNRKRGPLTRHARRPPHPRRDRRPHKAGRCGVANRGHERRNLEKQYLVRNRTLELLGRRPIANSRTNDSSLSQPVENVRRITEEKIGEILGDGRRTSPSLLQLSDLLLPKMSRKTGLPVPVVRTGESSGGRRLTVNRALQPSDCVAEERDLKKSGSAGIKAEPPIFLGKLKSIAMNVSRMNKAVQRFRENNSDVEVATVGADFHQRNYRYDYENVFEDPSVSPWVNPPRTKEAVLEPTDHHQEFLLDKALLSSAYTPIDDRNNLHDGLATLLSRLFLSLRNASDDENHELLQDLDFDNSVQGDLCQKWLDCKDQLEEAFVGTLVLPACPCHYPSSIFYDDKIWDEGQERHFRWRDVSGEAERLDVYKPGATYCIRSLLAQGGGSAAAQHCCYDGKRRLLTRGSGAGTPNFVSPEVSTVLHERIDVLPWRLCKGDFSRFNKVRPPNNDNHCKGNPDDEEYQRQIDTTKHY